MKLLRKRDIPEEKYSNAFLGFGPEESNFVVELTYSMLLFFYLKLFIFFIYVIVKHLVVQLIMDHIFFSFFIKMFVVLFIIY